MPDHERSFEEVRWDDVKEAVKKVNPEFYEITDSLKNKNRYPIYKAKYCYGDLILKSGECQIPSPKGVLEPIAETSQPVRKPEQLYYNEGGIPIGMVLNKSLEIFLQTRTKTIPFSIMKPGYIFALWGVLNTSHKYVAPEIWHITAGARSIFVLPKLTDTASYRKLSKTRGIHMPIPKQLNNHWALLKQVANHPGFSEKWNVEVIFFSKHWLNLDANLKGYLFQHVWETSEYWRNKVAYDHFWHLFMDDIEQQELCFSQNIIDILKHLIVLGLGVAPSSLPALNNELAPIKGMQEDLIHLYGLKIFSPTIMVPQTFSLECNRYAYWSIHFPTHFVSSTKNKTPLSTIGFLKEIHYLLTKLQEYVSKSSKANDLFSLLQHIKFDFFHSEPDEENIIRPSISIPREDPTFLKCSQEFGKRGFSDVSPFVRRCIRFGKK